MPRENLDLILGGMNSLGGVADAYEKTQARNKPASPVQKWWAKALAGEVSPQEAATYAKLEAAGHLPPDFGSPQAQATGMPKLTEGYGQGGPQMFQGEGVGAATGKRSAALYDSGLGGFDTPGAAPAAMTPPPPAAPPASSAATGGVPLPRPASGPSIDGAGPRQSGYQPPPVPTGMTGGLGATAPQARPPTMSSGLGAAPEVQTAEDYEASLAGAKQLASMRPNYRPTEDLKALEDNKSKNTAGRDEIKIKAREKEVARRLTDRWERHRDELKFKYDNMQRKTTELKARLAVMRERIGSDERVAAAARILEREGRKERIIGDIVTSTAGVLGDDNALQVKGDLEEEVKGMAESVSDADEALREVAKAEQLLNDAERDADKKVKGAGKKPVGQTINGQPVTPNTVGRGGGTSQGSSTTRRTVTTAPPPNGTGVNIPPVLNETEIGGGKQLTAEDFLELR